MIFQYKLVFVDRQTLRPAMKHKEVTPQFSIDIDELYRTQNIVNPRRGLQHVISDEQDRDILIQSTAQILSEMYAADVYYKAQTDSDWKFFKNVWQPRRF